MAKFQPNFFYIPFSVSQFKWQTWQPNNSIKSKQNHNLRSCGWVQLWIRCLQGANSRVRARAVYRCSKSSMKTTSLSKHPCIGHGFKMYHCFSILASILFTSSASLAACSIGPPCGALNFQNVESSTSSEGHGSTGKLFLKDNSHYLGAYSTTDYRRSLHFPHRWNAFYLCWNTVAHCAAAVDCG